MDDDTKPTGLDAEFLQWEYTLAARSDVLWAAVCLPLVRAADSLWQRAEEAGQLWADLFAGFETEPTANPRSLTARDLQVLDDVGLERVALMLLGFAIENVAKTLIIKAEPRTVADAKFLIRTHDLVALLGRAGIELTEKEKQKLRAVRDYLEWLGRYPVPLSALGKSGPESVDGAWVSQRLGPTQETWESARAVLQRAVDRRDNSLSSTPAM